MFYAKKLFVSLGNDSAGAMEKPSGCNLSDFSFKPLAYQVLMTHISCEAVDSQAQNWKS